MKMTRNKIERAEMFNARKECIAESGNARLVESN
jgi:hypothetical protein